MKKLLLFLSCTSIFGCESTDVSSDLATRAEGRYSVQTYVVNGDTLFSIDGKNKLGVSNFYIRVERIKANMVRLATFYTKDGATTSIAEKYARIEEVTNQIQISATVYEPFIYESNIKDGVFYERTVGVNVDSLKSFDILSSKETVISARK